MICDTNFDNVYWHYSGWFPEVQANDNITFKEGLPNISEIDTTKPNLIIIDDLMRESVGKIKDLFKKGCHHRTETLLFFS